MAIRLRESPDSRELHYGASGGGQTLKFTAVATGGESEPEVWVYALQNTSPYFNGFVRQDVKVSRQAGPLFTVEVEYGTTGVGGGDQPLGGAGNDGGSPSNPTAPAGDSTPLTSGYSFTVNCPRVHFTQSRLTVSATKRGGGVALDFKGKVGVEKSEGGMKVQGVDFPPEPRLTISRTWARAQVTQGYISTLLNLAGRPNNAPFYNWDAGQVILMSANGQFTQGEGWSITGQFGIEENEINIVICAGLVVPAKKGWEYLWVYDEWVRDGNDKVLVPGAAYVEELLRPASFALMEIG